MVVGEETHDPLYQNGAQNNIDHLVSLFDYGP
jgi:hypothetical protein